MSNFFKNLFSKKDGPNSFTIRRAEVEGEETKELELVKAVRITDLNLNEGDRVRVEQGARNIFEYKKAKNGSMKFAVAHVL